MELDWGSVFDNFGVKEVSKNDKRKGAFVPNAAQKAALGAAGIEPGEGGDHATRIKIHVINDPDWENLDTSYYASMRTGAGRRPELRMGRDFIRWINLHERIAVGNIGNQIYAWKDSDCKILIGDPSSIIAKTVDKNHLLARARKAKGRPSRYHRTVLDFERNIAVVAGALVRADGVCEMPGCKVKLFDRDDGTKFLEVHHVVPLAENGEDTLANAAAICPMCHRELHFGSNRLKKRLVLANAIRQKEG